ncbi:hypothetical protein B0H21DRAFT_693650 [Amylocystis lapponica]|nr:hypothetical protein B0H21DRAFT_693650 [Amylocystis lapponica]
MPPNKLSIIIESTSARASDTLRPLPPSALLPAPESAYYPTHQHSLLPSTLPSPGTIPTAVSRTNGAAAPIAADVQAVGELLDTMKLTLNAMAATFDTLSEQTTKVAELGPTIDAMHQIRLVRKQLSEQHQRQEERMQGVKKLLSEDLKVQLRDYLTPQVNLIVKEIIQREVAERVQRQLRAQVPEKLREEVKHYKHQITTVKHSLHNSEARRHNSLICSSGLDEPLRPLLRPLPMPTPSPLFPHDLASLTRLEPEAIKALLNDYGLVASAPHRAESPEGSSAAPAKKVRFEVAVDEEDKMSFRENMNRFIQYIGVSRWWIVRLELINYLAGRLPASYTGTIWGVKRSLKLVGHLLSGKFSRLIRTCNSLSVCSSVWTVRWCIFAV